MKKILSLGLIAVLSIGTLFAQEETKTEEVKAPSNPIVEAISGGVAGLLDTGEGPYVPSKVNEPGSGFFFGLKDIYWCGVWGLDLLPQGFGFTFGYKMEGAEGLDTVVYGSLGGAYTKFRTYRAADSQPQLPLTESYTDADGKKIYISDHLKGMQDQAISYNGDYPAQSGQKTVVPLGTEAQDGEIVFDSFYDKIHLWRALGNAELGLEQGILWNEELGHNLLSVGFLYKFKYEEYMGGRWKWYQRDNSVAIADAVEQYHADWQRDYYANGGTDAYGIIANTFTLSLKYDDVAFSDIYRTKKGIYAETSLEYMPYIPANPNLRNAEHANFGNDFLRYDLTFKGFLPVYETAYKNANKNLFSVYLADHFNINYADAWHNMPLYIMRENGPGVRGYDDKAYDTQLKMTNNAEIRMNFPGMYFKKLYAGLIAYWDVGYRYGYWTRTGDDIIRTDDHHFQTSIGAGIFLDLLGIEFVRVYCHFPLYDQLDHKYYDLFDVDFSLHF